MHDYIQPGARFSGAVKYVGYGDSLCVGSSADPSKWIEVRLADFYAPELRQLGGPEAKAPLTEIALGRSLACIAGARSYDRVVATCRIGGQPLGDIMRRAHAPVGGRGSR